MALDDFDQILEGIRLFKTYFGDVDIPVKFEVPKDDFWPSSLHGLRLGKRLEKLLTTSGRICKLILQVSLNAIFGIEFLNKHQGKVNQLVELGLKPSPDTLVDGRHSIILRTND